MVFLLCSINSNAQISVSGTSGGILNGSYTSFTNLFGVFAALNSGGSQAGQNITISVTGNVILETGTFSLNEGNWSSITITPNGSRTVSGSVSGPMIDLNGADNVNIDGLNASGNSLIISNTSISILSGTSTVRFVNGATANTITNCTILGSSQNLNNTGGGTIFFSTDAQTSNGNDNNIISNNNLGPAGIILPFKAILGAGSTSTAAIRNSGNQILNNNIYDFFGNGLGNTSGINIISGNDDWTISNNRIYQTYTKIFLGNDLRYAGITLNTSSVPGSFLVSGNRVGFANQGGTGVTEIQGLTNEFRGIDIMNVSIAVPTGITDNVVSGIIQSSARISLDYAFSAFIGISMGTAGGLVNATYNKIGSLDASSFIVLNHLAVTVNSAPVIGIYNKSNSSTNISYNTIGSIVIQGLGTVTGFRGILVSTGTALTATLNENTISNIIDNQVGVYSMVGIETIFADAVIYGNVINNFTGNAIAAEAVMGGILAAGSSGVNVIEKNKVFNLRNIDAVGVAGSVYGISVFFPLTANEIKQNYIYALTAQSILDIYQINGIIVAPGGNGTVYNNMISLGLNYDGSTLILGFQITGIRDIGGAPGSYNYYYNSVYIGGTSVLTSLFNSYCFYSSVVVTSREFKNNIFWNARSNAIILGAFHFAIAVGGLGPNPAGLSCDYNDLYVSGNDGAIGLYGLLPRVTLGNWQAATGQDANSCSVAPDFVSPFNGNLDLNVLSYGDENLIGTPIPGITTDIHKNERDPDYPYMGANEPSAALPVELASFISSVNGKNVILNWTTVSESNNAGFDIERAIDNGQLTIDSWSKVGNVGGSGTINEPRTYSFTDRNLASGNYSYRLKQIDFNGNFEYFNLNNEVIVGVPSNFSLSQNYPNPFNPTTNLEFGISELGLVTLKVYDISGKEVMTLVNEQKAPGYYKVSFNGASLSSGIYFYTIQSGSFVSTKKMTLIK